MRAVDIIVKKREGGELTREEITFFVEGYTSGEIADYQASAWAMAVYFRGMSPQEAAFLTEAMVASGERLDLSPVVPFAIDKHSTGGVGDKTTLVVLPAVAACGVPVGKMSGRGLGHTGGTLDKMESIAGFNIELTREAFLAQLASIGAVLAGQTPDLAPADKALYALRDVTGTVPSMPLIASSVMSKKIAAGANAVVLDVKIGTGAFMKTLEEAQELAGLMVEIGRHAGLGMIALVSDMNQPLGNAVGNALEVNEAIRTMCGDGPQDFRDHCVEVAGHMLLLANAVADLETGKERIAKSLTDGSALAKFREVVEAQGGDVSKVDDPSKLPRAKFIEPVPTSESGYVKHICADEIGLSVMALGGGREKKGDRIDYAVGVEIHHKVGDQVKQGDKLFTVHASDRESLQSAAGRVRAAHEIVKESVSPLPLFYDTIGR